MGIEKGRWVDGRYVDGNGNEITPPVSERPKGYNPSTGRVDEVENSTVLNIADMFARWVNRVFSIPSFTMLGVWILVYYQVTSHNHYQDSRGVGTYKSISGSVSVR